MFLQHLVVNLEGVEVVVHLLSRIEQSLFVAQLGYLLLSLRDTQVGGQLSLVEYGLGELGKIVAVDDSAENVLFEIDHDGRELLVPAVDEFVNEIDEENRRLYMSIPEGLLTL